jgi:hypothetical protein
MDWIQLAQDRDLWQAVVNVVMNLQVLVPWSELVQFKMEFYYILICL